MMTRCALFLLAALGTVLGANAQPIIGPGAISSIPGDHSMRAYCDTVPVGTAGAAQTWDMSTVSGCGTPILYNWTAPGATPLFPYTVALRYGTSSSMDFFTAIPNAFQLVRSAPFPNEAWIYTDTLDLVRYPMAYGDSFTDTFGGAHTTPVDDFTGTHTLTYDAYGTIILPWGTVENVFRLHSRDTLWVAQETFRSKITEVYEWYSLSMRAPLVRLVHIHGLDGIYQGGGTLLFVPDEVGIEEPVIGTGLALVPDPATASAFVRIGMRPLTVQAIDGSGRCCAVPFQWSEGAVRVDLTTLAPGLHCLVLRGAREQRTVRFVKE